MIVCVCHRVSDRDIAREVQRGCETFDDLQQSLRVATGCGACAAHAHEAFRCCRDAAAQPAELAALA